MGNICSGKGTIAQALIKTNPKFHLISFGNILRKEIKDRSSIGIKIEKYVSQGNFVPLEISNQILLKEIRSENCIVEGYPRRLEQIDVLLKLKFRFFYVLLSCSFDMALKRIQNRRICENCNTIHNDPEIKACSICSGKLTQRKDDMDNEIIATRYQNQAGKINEIIKSNKIKITHYDNSSFDYSRIIADILKMANG
jgi:adenylate kinase